MPSHLHETLVRMVRERPAMVADLLRTALGSPVPSFSHASTSSGELTAQPPVEYRADAVVALYPADPRATGPVHAVVVEVQLSPKRAKRRSWPVYVSTVHARMKCPVTLLVLCASRSIARWCAKPIVIGERCLVLRPTVLGPEQIPVVTDIEVARRMPELAVLSTIAHVNEAEPEPVFTAMFAALDKINPDDARLYYDLILTVLSSTAQKSLETFMSTSTHPFRSDFARKYYDLGEVKGHSTAILTILSARGVEVPAEARELITACTDHAQLETWLRQAAHAQSIDDMHLG